ncbi:MAG: response regulator transcription factor [Peptococcaceae bacterium]|nr:response regulator transcription factor [Peptococcaceae bacterium]
MTPIRVLIADDHVLVREGIIKILSLEDDIEIAGEAGDGQQAVKIALEKDFDIALLDVNMPVMDGIEACRLIKRKKPGVGVIALTIHDQEEYLLEFIRAGASAYLLKDISPGQLVETIKGVARGESYIPPKLMASVFQEINRISCKQQTGRQSDEDQLTPREIEVLQHVARGDSNRSIAKKLFISEKTVKNHLYRIFQKLNVEDRTQAALYAIKNKIVDL